MLFEKKSSYVLSGQIQKTASEVMAGQTFWWALIASGYLAVSCFFFWWRNVFANIIGFCYLSAFAYSLYKIYLFRSLTKTHEATSELFTRMANDLDNERLYVGRLDYLCNKLDRLSRRV